MSEIAQVIRSQSKDFVKIPKRYNLTHYFNKNIKQKNYIKILADFCDQDEQEAKETLKKLEKNGKITFGNYSFEISRTKLSDIKYYAKNDNYILDADSNEINNADR